MSRVVGRRRAPACLLLLVVLATGPVVAWSADSRADDPAPAVRVAHDRPWTTVTPRPAPSAKDTGPTVGGTPEQLQAEVEKVKRAEESREAARQTPDARAERERSRAAYRGLDRDAVRALARTTLKPQLDRPARPLADGPGRITAYLGRYGARVADDDGDTSIVDSLVPLRTADEHGDLAPTDLSLQAAASGFVAVNPLVDVTLPDRLGDGVAVDEAGVRLTFPDADADATGTEVDGAVLYADADADTDLVVQPQPGGFETYDVLRSPAAPEQLTFRFPGATLAQNGDGWITIRRDGRLVGAISKPAAKAADGDPVDVTPSVDGDRLVLAVAHRDLDVAYPVTVDPYMVYPNGTYAGDEYQWGNAGTSPLSDLAGWSLFSTAPQVAPLQMNDCAATQGHFCWSMQNWIYGPGAYIGMRDADWPGPNNYTIGEVGELDWRAPGQAYIYQAVFADVRNEYDSSCDYQGIFNDAGNQWEQGSWTDGVGHSLSYGTIPGGSWAPRRVCGADYAHFLWVSAGPGTNDTSAASTHPGYQQPGNKVVFGAQIPNTPIPSFTSFFSAAAIYVGDRDTPTVQLTGFPGPAVWTKDTTTPLGFNIADPGLGLQTADVKVDGTTAGSITNCVGGWHDPCPPAVQHGIPKTSLHEGINNIAWTVHDPVGHSADGSAVVRYDHSAPTASLSGTFFDHQGDGYVSGQSYAVNVDARDGDASNARSGVEKVELLVDGVVRGPAQTNTGCPASQDSCAKQASFTITPSGEAADAVLSIRTTDRAGNVRTSQPYPLRPDVAMTRLGLEKFWDYDRVDTGAGSQLLVNAETGNLLWHDVPVVNPGRGLSTFVSVTYNSLDLPFHLGQNGALNPLAGLAGAPIYAPAGKGMSLSISGPTRLNEPLQGVAVADERGDDGTTATTMPKALGNSVVLVDADGTRHTFARDSDDGRRWVQPAGARLTLRHMNAADTNFSTKRWVMTRPDGVAYFYNKLGYLIATQDRNGRALTYVYQYYDLLTGQSGPSALACALTSVLGSVAGVSPSASNSWGLGAPLAKTVT
ncbi:MAG: Rhs family protein, partial [Frankiales bacterium]|nr:Rhs family protein [Frankiales bacterium]